MKCNAIFLDANNEKQQDWFFRMVKMHLIKITNYRFSDEYGGFVIVIKGILSKYVIWRNEKFLGDDLMTIAIAIPRE